MKRILPLILTLLGLCFEAHAQKGLAIDGAFGELAVKRNATEVMMGPGRLRQYRLSLFHSLEIKAPTAAQQQFVEAQIRADAAQATLHKESAGHKLYDLPERRGLHRYIFYRAEAQSLLLIYIEGKATLKQIESTFLKQP